MKTIPRMCLENTGLSAFYPGCEELFYKWFNDKRIYLHMGDIDQYPISQNDALSYTNNHKKDTWLIVVNENEHWKPIGYLGIFIRTRHRVGIIRYAIGDENYLGKGHAKRAIHLALEWSFKESDLESVIASVSSANPESRNLLLKVGFSKCGMYHNVRMENGIRYDEYHFEFLKPKL